jgi:hypothetical protein
LPPQWRNLLLAFVVALALPLLAVPRHKIKVEIFTQTQPALNRRFCF